MIYTTLDGRRWRETASDHNHIELERVDDPSDSMVRSRMWVRHWTKPEPHAVASCDMEIYESHALSLVRVPVPESTPEDWASYWQLMAGDALIPRRPVRVDRHDPSPPDVLPVVLQAIVTQGTA